jgi:hypothetical protein
MEPIIANMVVVIMAIAVLTPMQLAGGNGAHFCLRALRDGCCRCAYANGRWLEVAGPIFVYIIYVPFAIAVLVPVAGWRKWSPFYLRFLRDCCYRCAYANGRWLEVAEPISVYIIYVPFAIAVLLPVAGWRNGAHFVYVFFVIVAIAVLTPMADGWE